jgi:hypothetical protein
MNLLFAYEAALTALFILCFSATPTAWTYQAIYDYGIAHGGPTDVNAKLVAQHVASSGKTWDDLYDNDIVTDSGGVLHVGSPFSPPDPPPSLAKRQSYTPPDGMTGFPYTTYCDSDFYYTWDNVGLYTCYAFWSGGELLNMESVYVNFQDGWELEGYFDDDNCNGGTTQHYDYSVDCIAASGSSWQSVRPV